MVSVAEVVPTIKFDFEEPTEITAQNVGIVFNTIAARRGLNLPSYGAYVLRSCNPSALEDVIELLRAHPHSRHSELRKSFFKKWVGNPLHSDLGVTNTLTVHHTRRSTVKAAVLIGSVELPGYAGLEDGKKHELSTRLVEASELPAGLVSEPTRALLTELGPDDILLFDHSQMHTFRSPDRVRESTAYYYV